MHIFRLLAILCCALPAVAETATTLTWKKKFGGSDYDRVNALTTDAQGNFYLAGIMSSMDLPATGVYPEPRGTNLFRLGQAGEIEPLRTAVAGGVRAIATGSAASGVVYVATSSGLMRTSDGGRRWTGLALPPPPANPWFVGTSLPTLYAIAVDPRNADVAYLAAGIQGVLKTVDGGKTWQQSLALAPAIHVAVDPAAPSIVYASVVGPDPAAYRSDNAGVNWVRLGRAATSIVPDASTPGTIYGSIDSAPMRSADRGAFWQPLALPGNCSFTSLLSDPVLRGNLYLNCYSSLYRSRDRGEKWQAAPVPLDLNETITAAAADASLPLLQVITSGGRIWRSADAGATWKLAGQRADQYTGPEAASGGNLYIGSQRDFDGFAAKFTAGGDLVWATYLGGSGSDSAETIAVDSQGNVFVAGSTQSADFPLTRGAYDGGKGQGKLAFVVKLSPDGRAVEYAALLKLNGSVGGLAVDSAGSAYLSGETESGIVTTPGVVFPDTGNGCSQIAPCDIHYKPHRNFALKLAPGGSSLAYSTYLGDWTLSYFTGGAGVAVDSEGNAHVIAGGALWKLNSTASALLYSTALTGCSFTAAALDSANNLIVGGTAGQNLYTTPGVWKPWSDEGDGCLARYSPRGQLLGSTSMGAGVFRVAAAPGGDVLAGGTLFFGSYYTKSMLEGPFGNQWLARVSGDFSRLLFSSHLRGDGMSAGSLTGDAMVAVSSYAVGIPYADGPTTDILLYRADTAGTAAPRIDSIRNEADPNPTPVSASERIVVAGSGIVGDDARVRFGDLEGEIVGRAANAVTVVVPPGLQPGEAGVALESGGRRSAAVPMPVAWSSPAIYRANPRPDTQALAFNQDGTANSPANPAARGSILAFAVNGISGLTASGISVIPSFEPAVFLGGRYAYGVDANLLPAPGLQGLVVFLKVLVPDEVDARNGLPGPVDLILTSAGQSSGSMTVWVK